MSPRTAALLLLEALERGATYDDEGCPTAEVGDLVAWMDPDGDVTVDVDGLVSKIEWASRRQVLADLEATIEEGL